MKRSILVALSGGVDSSVTAALLLEAGHSLVSATLKTFCYNDVQGGPKSCCGLEGITTARAVAGALGIQHFVFDVSDRFQTEVIDDFVGEYAAGRTPNPCVRCNATVKIPDLLERARKLGYEAIATGHYARVAPTSDGVGLFRAKDRTKDQAYFLWEVPSGILKNLYFPLGDLTKTEVRELARQRGLISADKPESQEICFIPDLDYMGFVRRRLPPDHQARLPGPIIDTAGRSLGTHQGFLEFTVGQRKGLGGGHGRKLYVTAIDPARRTVIAGELKDLEATSLIIDRVNQLAPTPAPDTPVTVMIRHRAKAIPGFVRETAGGSWRIELGEPARAVTPGQSAVIFSPGPEDRLLAGGRIIGR